MNTEPSLSSELIDTRKIGLGSFLKISSPVNDLGGV
jgi:hypothetical protein